MLLVFSSPDAAESFGAFDSLVVVSRDVEDAGLAATTGGLTIVFLVTVWLVTLGAAGTVVTVLFDSVVVWDHAVPARPMATPITAANIHKLKVFIVFNLLAIKY